MKWWINENASKANGVVASIVVFICPRNDESSKRLRHPSQKKPPGNYSRTRLICVAFHGEHSGPLSRTCVCHCVGALLVNRSGATEVQLTTALRTLIANYRLHQVMAKHTAEKRVCVCGRGGFKGS